MTIDNSQFLNSDFKEMMFNYGKENNFLRYRIHVDKGNIMESGGDVVILGDAVEEELWNKTQYTFDEVMNNMSFEEMKGHRMAVIPLKEYNSLIQFQKRLFSITDSQKRMLRKKFKNKDLTIAEDDTVNVLFNDFLEMNEKMREIVSWGYDDLRQLPSKRIILSNEKHKEGKFIRKTPIWNGDK